MARAQILTIDQGTTNTKALLVDSAGRILQRASRPMALECPQPGWIQQDAAALWAGVREVIEEILTTQGAGQVAALAISNQRESVIVWERATGRPLGPCVIWQCRRTAPFCAELRRQGKAASILSKTGLGIDPLFSATKAHWLLEQIPGGLRRAAGGELCAGTVDSWLLFHLTGGAVHACDFTNASRTQLMNLDALQWDADLIDWFGVPRPALPSIQPSSGIFGLTAGFGPLPAGLPIAAMIGDSHGALFAHASFRPGVTKATYGTGSSLMRRTAARANSKSGLSSTIAWSVPGRAEYGLEGNITMTGGAVQWTAELLGLEGAEALAARAAGAEDTGGVYLVPAMAGLGAPYWRDDVRGLITGLSRGSTAAHLARAALESVAYQVRDVFDAMVNDTGEAPHALLADGGASRNDGLMQFQADILGCPVVRNLSADLSALGAAHLAGLATGIWKDASELEVLPREEQRFEPRITAAQRDALYAGWRRALAQALSDSPASTVGT